MVYGFRNFLRVARSEHGPGVAPASRDAAYHLHVLVAVTTVYGAALRADWPLPGILTAPAGDIDAAAVADYHASLLEGKPLSERKLAATFDKTSRRWARARKAEARQDRMRVDWVRIGRCTGQTAQPPPTTGSADPLVDCVSVIRSSAAHE